MGTLKNIRRTKMLAQQGRCYYCGLKMWMSPSIIVWAEYRHCRQLAACPMYC